ncbi:MAG: trypsin-like peptidase domain-containing protein [Clostridia bacterium]|nr:trypsin-like peptidase domain-containing protein [Clostridia bacterium]
MNENEKLYGSEQNNDTAENNLPDNTAEDALVTENTPVTEDAPVTENAPVTEDVPETVAPVEEKKYYIPPHDDGWQPYDPSRRYTNNWSASDKKKGFRGKKLLIVGLVTAGTILFFTILLGLVLLLKDLEIPGLFPDDIFPEVSDEVSSGGGEVSRNEDASAPDGETSLIPTDNPDLNMNITDYDKITTAYTELYEKCSGSCVSVICTFDKSSGYTLGSGFVLSEDGYIATNHHVIEDADEITVQFYDGTEYEATLIGSDSITDLAVLRIEAKGLVPAELGNSDKVSVGEPVVAIGTPYDITLKGTMTTGVVSGLAREVECTDDYGNVVKTMTLIQTDASINPGNSGGPLFNMNGQVIGINTLKLMNEYEGLGFSIPITDAIEVFEILVKYGELPDYSDTDFVKTSPKLHIIVMSVSDARNSVEYGRYISKDAPEGVYVIEVTPGTAIYEAGLEIYDIITEFNGVVLEDRDDLAAELAKCSAGQQVTIKVYHRGEYKTLTFKLDKAG